MRGETAGRASALEDPRANATPSAEPPIEADETQAQAEEKASAALAPPSPVGDSGWTVTEVVDGDTLDVSRSGVAETVRLIGIDSPESGACGSIEAASNLTVLTLGQVVTLTPGADEDRDRYSRLLRYVDLADGRDAGREQIGGGFAIARYDSRDGYGAHPRETDYVALDATIPDVTCPPPAPDPVPVVPPPPPAPDPEVYYANCDAARAVGAAPLYASDPGYRPGLDRDGDGVACE
jgi:endonuclease YncB( thermonuclease family)